MSPDFRVLGSLEVTMGHRVLDLGRPKQRALLSRFLMEPNAVVSLGRLVEDVWEGSPPKDPPAALQPQVSRLRRSLATVGRPLLVRRSPGYALCLEDEELDAWRFEQAVTNATRELAVGRPGPAREILREALGWWRGSPFTDVAYCSFAQPEIARLEGLRMSAVETLVEARLALDQHQGLLAELDALVIQHPLRERLHRQRMLALYRSGRQAEALRTYQDLRRTLDEELGIEPSPELKDLELAILRQDTSLLAPAPAITAP